MPAPLRDLAWRTLYRAGFPAALCWWCVTRPRHRGALVAVHVGDRLLLLRASYRRAWNFPGGSIARGETPEQAARRELAEETGIEAADLRLDRVLHGLWDFQRDEVHVFALRLEALPPLRLDDREIVGFRLATPAAAAALRLTGPVRAWLRVRAQLTTRAGSESGRDGLRDRA